MLSVGLNAAPLAAPHTGVGRYILGVLRGLERLRAAGEAFEVRALFAPAAALRAGGAAADGSSSDRPPAASGGALPALRALRSAAKRVPFAYPLAEAARALGLAAAGRAFALGVYHETNHAAPRTRLPVVLTVHDLSTLLMPATQERKRADHFGRALRLRARDAARVIAPTRAIADQIVAELAVSRDRVRAIHHGVDPALLEALGRPAVPSPRLAALGATGPYLLFLGALGPRKGLPVLLDAYDALPAPLARTFPLVLGGPADQIDEALRRRLGARREGRIVQLGYVAAAELPALYRGAAAFCLPSLYEGFGLPLLEALACGTPCVASDDPALVEVAEGAVLHSARGDAGALAGQLCRVLDDGALRAELARKGPARAADFTWEESARAHLQAYREAGSP
ncbi:MAG: hypothetical protein NVSMB23_08220 [Myxococcales bacterium]